MAPRLAPLRVERVMRTLRKNWIWIVAPIVIVAVVVAVMLALSSDAIDTGIYPIF